MPRSTFHERKRAEITGKWLPYSERRVVTDMKNPRPADWNDGILFEKDPHKVCDAAAKALTGDPRCKSTQTEWWIELCNQLDRNQHLACARRHRRGGALRSNSTARRSNKRCSKRKHKKKTKKQNRKG